MYLKNMMLIYDVVIGRKKKFYLSGRLGFFAWGSVFSNDVWWRRGGREDSCAGSRTGKAEECFSSS